MSSIDNAKFFTSTGLLFSPKPIKRQYGFMRDLLVYSSQPIRRRRGFIDDCLVCIGNSSARPMSEARVNAIGKHLLQLEAKHKKPMRAGPPPKPTTSYPPRPQRFKKDLENRILAKFGLTENDLLYIDEDLKIDKV